MNATLQTSFILGGKLILVEYYVLCANCKYVKYIISNTDKILISRCKFLQLNSIAIETFALHWNILQRNVNIAETLGSY